MFKEIKVFCPICKSQEIIIRTNNGAFFIDEDFIPNSVVNLTHTKWKCGKCEYEAKGNNFYIAQRTMTDIEEAYELISNFMCSEYKDNKDEAIQTIKKNKSLIPIAGTTIGENEELEAQTYINLCEYKILYYIDDKLIETESYNNLKEMNELFLKFLDFDKLVSPQMLYNEN